MSEDQNEKDFIAQAAGPRTSLLGELVAFLRQNKKWWIAPIVIAILLFGLLVVLGGTGAAPFIYTLY